MEGEMDGHTETNNIRYAFIIEVMRVKQKWQHVKSIIFHPPWPAGKLSIEELLPMPTKIADKCFHQINIESRMHKQ